MMQYVICKFIKQELFISFRYIFQFMTIYLKTVVIFRYFLKNVNETIKLLLVNKAHKSYLKPVVFWFGAVLPRYSNCRCTATQSLPGI